MEAPRQGVAGVRMVEVTNLGSTDMRHLYTQCFSMRTLTLESEGFTIPLRKNCLPSLVKNLLPEVDTVSTALTVAAQNVGAAASHESFILWFVEEDNELARRVWELCDKEREKSLSLELS
jgi:hypothetical protein